MGVKCLQAYINKHCPAMMEPVNIFAMANQHRRMFNVTPILVIDGFSFIQRLYMEGGLESYFGGQWIEFSNNLLKFLELFINNKIKLVFFFDGCHVQSKRKEWVSRRIDKHDQIMKVFHCLKTKKYMSEKLQKQKKPTGFACLAKMTIKFLCKKVEVFTTLNDADVEIADYARKHEDVFGILSNDTDFIIFDTKSYLSLKDLNFEHMSTNIYNRSYLCSHLSLEQEQLPLFSCLMGNDFVSTDVLDEFHERLTNTFDQHCNSRSWKREMLAESVASFIRFSGWRLGITSSEQCSISHEICQDDSLKEIIKEGIAMYRDFSLPVKIACVVGSRHVASVNASEIYNIYIDKIYESSEVMEDGKDTNLCSANVAYREFRQRLYSIIFHNYEVPYRQVSVSEWCAYYRHDMRTPDVVHPEPIPRLKNIEFSMEDLWEIRDKSIKFQYFAACLDTNLTGAELETIEPKFVVFCSIINYLLTNFNPPILKEFEVNAFIVQAVYIQDKTPEEIHDIRDPSIDTRAIHICSIFMKGVTEMILALGVCGYPIECEDALPMHYFDGKIFHKMYESAKTNMLDYEINNWQLYNELYDKATKGVNFDYRELQ